MAGIRSQRAIATDDRCEGPLDASDSGSFSPAGGNEDVQQLAKVIDEHVAEGVRLHLLCRRIEDVGDHFCARPWNIAESNRQEFYSSIGSAELRQLSRRMLDIVGRPTNEMTRLMPIRVLDFRVGLSECPRRGCWFQMHQERRSLIRRKRRKFELSQRPLAATAEHSARDEAARERSTL